MIHIAFSTNPKNLLSRVIRWFTKSRVSHTFIVFRLFGWDWILESGLKGVVILPLDKFAGEIVVLVPIPELAPDDLGKVMENGLGRNYDFTGLFGMAVTVIGRWLKAKWKNPWNNSHSMFCSEFVVEALQECEFEGANQLDAANTTPQDVLEFLTEHYVKKA